MKFGELVLATAKKEQSFKTSIITWMQQWMKQPVQIFKNSFVGRATTGIKNWLIMERVIALILIVFPVLLIVMDVVPNDTKDAISDYYKMNNPNNLWAFYVPLTIAAFMFIVNGVVKRKSLYNIYLGVALTGVILFNQDDFGIIHQIFAYSFFIGNFLVIKFAKTGVFKTPRAEFIFDLSLVVSAALSLVLLLTGVINLFVLEWISLAVISTHYFLLSCGTKTISVEENKKVVRKWVKKSVKGDKSALELLTSNCVLHNLEVIPYIDTNRESLEPIFDNPLPLSDVSLTIRDIVAERDKVVVYGIVRGTNTGKFMNNEPTGKNASSERLSIFRIEDGKIAEGWAMGNILSMYQQLGITPPTG